MGIFDKSSSPLSTLFPQTSPYKEPDYTKAFENYSLSILNNSQFQLGNILRNSSDPLNKINGLNLWNDALSGRGFNGFLTSTGSSGNDNNQNSSNFNWNNGLEAASIIGSNTRGQTGNILSSASGIGSNIRRVSELNKKIKTLSGDELKNAKLEKNGAIASAVGIGSDLVDSFLPLKTEYSGKKGGVTQTADSVYDSILNAAAYAGPYGLLISGAMASAKLLGKGINALGGGTDGQTTTDAILGSSFLNLTPLGLVNGFGGKKADTITKDNEAFAQVGSSYTGSESTVNDALTKSGKKYGLLSSGARKKANREIAEAKRLQSIISNISDDMLDRTAIRTSMSAINGNRRRFQMQGGYDLAAIRIGRRGMSIDLLLRARTILKALRGVKLPYKVWVKDVNPNFLSKYYDLETAYNYLPIEQLNRWKKAVNSKNPNYYMNYKDKLGNYPYHLGSIAPIKGTEDYIFLKKGTEKEKPELHWETDTYYNGSNGLKNTHDLVYEGDRYYYRKKKSTPKHQNGGTLIELVKESVIELVNPDDIPEFKNGGSINVIPDGALHARKHNMDLEGITEKGIPVVSEGKDGKLELHAEVEKNEIIFRLAVTEKLEKLLKKFNKEDATLKEKDEYALEAGKLLVKEILHNTLDNANLL